MIRCTKCQTINADDAIFCTNCASFLEWTGERIDPAEAKTTTEPPPAPEPPPLPPPEPPEPEPPEPGPEPAAPAPAATAQPNSPLVTAPASAEPETTAEVEVTAPPEAAPEPDVIAEPAPTAPAPPPPGGETPSSAGIDVAPAPRPEAETISAPPAADVKPPEPETRPAPEPERPVVPPPVVEPPKPAAAPLEPSAPSYRFRAPPAPPRPSTPPGAHQRTTAPPTPISPPIPPRPSAQPGPVRPAMPAPSPPRPAPTQPEARRPTPITEQPLHRRPQIVPEQPPRRRPPTPQPMTTEPQVKPGDLICAICGAGNNPDRRFCRRCGNSLATAVVAVQPPWYRRLFGRNRRAIAAGQRPGYMGRTGMTRGSVIKAVVVVSLLLAVVLPIVGYVAVPSFRDRIGSLFADLTSDFTLSQHPSQNALDRDATSFWLADPARGAPTLTVSFEETEALAGLLFHAGAGTGADFRTYARPRLVELHFPGESLPVSFELKDTPAPQLECLDALHSVQTFEIRVLSTYPPDPTGQDIVAVRGVEFRSGNCQ